MLEQIWNLITALLGALLGLLTQLVNLVVGFLGLPGVVMLVVVVLLVILALKNTENNLLAAAGWIAGTLLIVYVLWTWVGYPFIFSGSDKSYQSCIKAASGNQEKLKLCGGGTTSSLSSSGSGQQATVPPQQYLLPTQPALQPTQQVVRTFKKNALALLTANWSLKPGDWPNKLGLVKGPRDVPLGIRIVLQCKDCIKGEEGEVWNLTLSDPSGFLDPFTAEVNGFFARDDAGMASGTSGVSLVGVGSWETLCSSCYTDTVIVPTPTPTPTPGANPPPATPPPASTQVAPKTCTVTRPGGWGWKKLAGLVYQTCGVSFSPEQLEAWNPGLLTGLKDGAVITVKLSP